MDSNENPYKLRENSCLKGLDRPKEAKDRGEESSVKLDREKESEFVEF